MATEADRPPKPLMDKLGVKVGQRIAVLGLDDESFLGDLRERVPDFATGRARADSDTIFVAAERHTALSRLQALQRAIVPNGAIWVVWPRGRADINGNRVREAALAAGLVDVKVVRFSDTHGALKLVVPLARRPELASASKQRKAAGAAKRRAARHPIANRGGGPG
jgi:hypothetical protein